MILTEMNIDIFENFLNIFVNQVVCSMYIKMCSQTNPIDESKLLQLLNRTSRTLEDQAKPDSEKERGAKCEVSLGHVFTVTLAQ